MELITPALGLIFWMTLAFAILWFVLGKFAWPPIMKALKEREESIENALHEAQKARAEMEQLRFDNQVLLKEAKEERDAMMRDARKVAESLVDEARNKATTEYQRIVESARETIQNEKMAAVTDLKNQLAQLSIEVAEKILREKLKDEEKQNSFIKKLMEETKFS